MSEIEKNVLRNCILAVISQFFATYQLWRFSFIELSIFSVYIVVIALITVTAAQSQKNVNSLDKHPNQIKIKVEKLKSRRAIIINENSEKMLKSCKISFFFSLLAFLPIHISLQHVAVFISGLFSLYSSSLLVAIISLYEVIQTF